MHEDGKLDTFKARHKQGLDPDGTPPGEKPKTVGDLCDRFYEDRIAPFRSRPETAKWVLDHDIKKAIGKLPVTLLDKTAVAKPVKAAVERGSASHATTVLGIVKMLTKYAYNHDLIEVDFGASLDRKYLGAEAHSRSRFLGEDELPIYLRTMEPPKRPAREKLGASEMMLFGYSILLRIGERPIALRNALWSDIDLKKGIWTQPPERQAKKKKEERETAQAWEIPLSRQTVRLLKKMHALTGSGDHVWPVDDHAANRAMSRLQKKGVLVLDASKDPLCLYDLRRTLRAGMERLEVAYEVCEKILNHRVKGAVAATYARDPLIERRREAVQKWADYLDRIVKPMPENVVSITQTSVKAASRRAEAK